MLIQAKERRREGKREQNTTKHNQKPTRRRVEPISHLASPKDTRRKPRPPFNPPHRQERGISFAA